MTKTIIGAIIIISILLIFIILLQNKNDDKFQDNFINSNGSQIIGIKKTKNVLNLTTWVLFFFMAIIILFSSMSIKKIKNKQIIKKIEKNEYL